MSVPEHLGQVLALAFFTDAQPQEQPDKAEELALSLLRSSLQHAPRVRRWHDHKLS